MLCSFYAIRSGARLIKNEKKRLVSRRFLRFGGEGGVRYADFRKPRFAQMRTLFCFAEKAFHPHPTSTNKKRTPCDVLFCWRRGRDSNPRAISHKLISSQPRYDHFDTSPNIVANPQQKYYTIEKREKSRGKVAKARENFAKIQKNGKKAEKSWQKGLTSRFLLWYNGITSIGGLFCVQRHCHTREIKIKRAEMLSILSGGAT